MNVVQPILELVGSLGFLLYGMKLMSDGVQQSAGEKLQRALSVLTGNRFMSLLTGLIVTMIIQSSGATTVMVVTFVNAGLMTLGQSMAVIMGANIGTTVTAQIIRLMDIDSGGSMILEFFKPSTLAPVAMIAGIILIMFVKSSKSNTPGEICMGFGILFSGLMNMTAAVEPLSESPEFLDLMQRFGDQPILALLVGLVMTVIVQSSSAMVGMIQALSVTGAMTFNLVYPMIMGINLGTCVTTAMVLHRVFKRCEKNRYRAYCLQCNRYHCIHDCHVSD